MTAPRLAHSKRTKKFKKTKEQKPLIVTAQKPGPDCIPRGRSWVGKLGRFFPENSFGHQKMLGLET